MAKKSTTKTPPANPPSNARVSKVLGALAMAQLGAVLRPHEARMRELSERYSLGALTLDELLEICQLPSAPPPLDVGEVRLLQERLRHTGLTEALDLGASALAVASVLPLDPDDITPGIRTGRARVRQYAKAVVARIDDAERQHQAAQGELMMPGADQLDDAIVAIINDADKDPTRQAILAGIVGKYPGVDFNQLRKAAQERIKALVSECVIAQTSGSRGGARFGIPSQEAAQ